LFIPDPDPDFLPIPDPGSRGQKGTGSRIPYPDLQHWTGRSRDEGQEIRIKRRETLYWIFGVLYLRKSRKKEFLEKMEV
jgi:hypothetical protein